MFALLITTVLSAYQEGLMVPMDFVQVSAQSIVIDAQAIRHVENVLMVNTDQNVRQTV